MRQQRLVRGYPPPPIHRRPANTTVRIVVTPETEWASAAGNELAERVVILWR